MLLHLFRKKINFSNLDLEYWADISRNVNMCAEQGALRSRWKVISKNKVIISGGFFCMSFFSVGWFGKRVRSQCMESTLDEEA